MGKDADMNKETATASNDLVFQQRVLIDKLNEITSELIKLRAEQQHINMCGDAFKDLERRVEAVEKEIGTWGMEKNDSSL